MKTEAELTKEMQEGERARQLIKDPMIQEALKGMRETIFHNIQTSNWKDTDEREELYKQLKAVDYFEKEFVRRIKGGDVARSRLKDLLSKVMR